MGAIALAIPSILSAVGAVAGGIGESRAAELEALQTETQAQAARTQSAVEAQSRQDQLRRVLSAQTAVFGTTGAGLTSGSFGRIQEQDVSAAARQQTQATTLSNIRQSQFRFQAGQQRQAGRSALFKGFIGGGQSLLNTPGGGQ